MSIQWKEEYSTGVATIDEQHQKLIEGLNKLQLAMQQDKGNEHINGLLSFLERYAKEHFGFEKNAYWHTSARLRRRTSAPTMSSSHASAASSRSSTPKTSTPRWS